MKTAERRFVDFLPGIYREDDFADRFLTPFEGVFDGLQEVLSETNCQG